MIGLFTFEPFILFLKILQLIFLFVYIIKKTLFSLANTQIESFLYI